MGDPRGHGLQTDTDGPDVFEAQRRLLSDKFAPIPGFASRDNLKILIHDSSPKWRNPRSVCHFLSISPSDILCSCGVYSRPEPSSAGATRPTSAMPCCVTRLRKWHRV